MSKAYLKIGLIVVVDIIFFLYVIGIQIPSMISAKDDFSVWSGIILLLLGTPIVVYATCKSIFKILQQERGRRW